MFYGKWGGEEGRVNLNETDDSLREFVISPQGVVVNAGPGTGKTFALRRRANFLITKCGVDPKDIFYVTFIRGIAGQFRQELEDAGLRQREELCDEIQQMNVGTFHSLALGHLERLEGARSRAVSILFEGDPVLDDALAIIHKGPALSKEHLQIQLAHHYATAVPGQPCTDPPHWLSSFEQTCERYQVRDISMAVAELLRVYSESRDVFVNTLALSSEHFLFDEFQDFNPVEQAYAKLLCEQCSSYRIVGDVDQSIFGWRYVNSRALLEAARTLDAETVAFDTVRRCPPEVVAAANTIPANPSWNRGGLPPQLTAQRERSEPLRPWLPPLAVIRASNQRMIARAVAHILSRLVDEYANAAHYPSVLIIYFGTSDPSAKIQQELDKQYSTQASGISLIRGPGKRDAPEVETLMLLADTWSERAKPYHWRKLLALLAKNASTQCTQAVLATLRGHGWTDADGYVGLLMENLRGEGLEELAEQLQFAAGADQDDRQAFLRELNLAVPQDDVIRVARESDYHERREGCLELLGVSDSPSTSDGLTVDVVKQTQVKGMTRDIVMLYDCRKSLWEKDGGNDYEYQRVIYVCLTRATRSLVLTVADNYRDKQRARTDRPADFVNSIEQLTECCRVRADKDGVAWPED